MPTLNPHTFPLVPYPGLAPELATRSGMGGWDAYVLDAPSDRLLPFVLTRRLLPSNSAWVNCAWLEHADTGERVETLVPTGALVPVPLLGLVFTKMTDAANEAEHFTYDGALIAGLAVPCGIPLRLIVDNAYQSPRFYALAPAARLRESHLLLQWYHTGPLQGVPYGRGFRQHFYIDNGSLQHLDPREVEQVSKNPDSGAEKSLSLSLFGQKSFALPSVPAYLSEALTAARAPYFFLADNEPWRLLTIKTTGSADGGRWAVSGTLESAEPLLSRGCQVPALEAASYDPVADAPRGWRCGDAGDTASDYRATGLFSCELASGVNTGYVLETYRDLNPYSGKFGGEERRRSLATDLVRCPVPFPSREVSATVRRNNCGTGFTGSRETLTVPAGAYTSPVSEADATAQAQTYADTNAQAYANANGTCTATGGGGGGSSYGPVYTPAGCFACQMVNYSDPADVRTATPDEVNEYFVPGPPNNQCPDCI